jgi:hypothetical protein
MISCKDANKIKNDRIELSDTKIMNREKYSLQVINTDVSNKVNTDELLKMVTSINYIQLDSQEPIGEITKMTVTKEYIYILDSFISQQIFVFDTEGKLVFQIKNKGQGPEEYISMWDMQIDTLRNEIIVNDAIARRYIYYSSRNGEFIKKEQGIANCYFAHINNSYVNLLAHNQDFNDDENWSIVITDKDSILSKGFPLMPIQKDNYIVNSLYYDNGGELLYTPINSDTVYQINSGLSYFPKYVISQKKSIWTKYNDNLLETDISTLVKESNYTRYCGNFLSTERYVFFGIQHEWHGFISSKPYIWDRKNNIVYEWEVTQPSIIRDIVTSPFAVFNNTFYGYFSSEGLLETHGNMLNPKLIKILEKSNSDSNPILVLFELND